LIGISAGPGTRNTIASPGRPLAAEVSFSRIGALPPQSRAFGQSGFV
jgi:hypothetical protein